MHLKYKFVMNNCNVDKIFQLKIQIEWFSEEENFWHWLDYFPPASHSFYVIHVYFAAAAVWHHLIAK